MNTTIEDMTLRDWFAGQALPALLAAPNLQPLSLATDCYKIADLLLEARANPRMPGMWWVRNGQPGYAGSAIPYDPRMETQFMIDAGWTLTRELPAQPPPHQHPPSIS